jgi:Fe-S oxidoreductase
MQATRIIIANHMHAGDGNCHVNIPVNSNDPDMLFSAEEAVGKVFDKVHELGGEITGEHGVGITKIAYLAKEKIEALKDYKEKVDPGNILNPGKLTRRKLSVEPYTFSFNRLIQDIKRSGLADKHRLIQMLTNVQTCTRCGKCKQVCPMFDPRSQLIFHPRNKNISLGAIIEAIYYSQALTGEPDKELLSRLRDLVEHCTACGKCHGVCPVKIDTADVTLHLRSFLEDKGAGGHPFKRKLFDYITKDTGRRLPRTAKVLSVGQRMGNRVVEKLPASWRERAVNPIFQGRGPDLGFRNLSETLNTHDGSMFAPEGDAGERRRAVLYFPGCGAGLFYRDIGRAALYLLIRSGVCVVMPPKHMCCGYPLVSSGCQEAFALNRENNISELRDLLARAGNAGLTVDRVLTSCGTCREGLSKYGLEGASFGLEHMDVNQFLMENLPEIPGGPGRLLYHAACHAEWSGVAPNKSGQVYAAALERITGASVTISPGCCGESGLGAMTSPDIYNRIRKRKRSRLMQDLSGYPEGLPVVAGCPSCKIGLTRTIRDLDPSRPVLHTIEYLAARLGGDAWAEELMAGLQGPDKAAVRTVRLPETESMKA